MEFAAEIKILSVLRVKDFFLEPFSEKKSAEEDRRNRSLSESGGDVLFLVTASLFLDMKNLSISACPLLSLCIAYRHIKQI